VRACERLGVREAAVPPEFPVALADLLRAAGITLHPDRELFGARRRAKNEAELAGVRRAQHAAEAGMRTAAAFLRRDGELTVEEVKEAIDAAFAEHGATADAYIVAPGAQGAVGHDLGSGPIPLGVPVVVDLWPQDRASGCFADMTRTFVRGDDVPDDVRRWHALCRDALGRVTEAIAPGAGGRELFDLCCDVFEAAGEPTQRTKAPGETLRDGFLHSLGHGVGLEVHEPPGLGRGRSQPLVAGDVVAVEPGCYRAGYGGVRLEDLVLVTEDGAEVLTDFPYELAP
jgi:Xaa-Pro aminopeptidase